MRPFTELPLPQQEDPAAQGLADAITEVQHEIQNAVDTVHDLNILNREPDKPYSGMVRYADGVSWDPGDGPGPYCYREDEWVPLFPVATSMTPLYVLAGAPNNGTINTGNFKLVNYPDDFVGTGMDAQYIDRVAGEITIPTTGVWTLTAWVFGYQGNDQKEESMFLKADVDGVKHNIAVFAVATDKTDDRYFAAVLTREFAAGQVVSLFMSATAGMGTFNFENATFELFGLEAT